ncbi:MAG: GHKL domain-containing protein [Candidatus Marinimicrobia bacterium]|nr:GHKL domain-containing protein [Candidatus Neomarinimicrobiota bacterium]
MKLKKINISPYMLLFLFIIFVIILGLSLYSNYISQKNATIEMMTHSSHQLSSTIRKASRNTIIAYRLFLHHFNEQLISDLRYLDYLDLNNDLNQKNLTEYAHQERFNAIYVLDKNGNVEITNTDEEMPELPADTYNDLNEGKFKKRTFDILPARNQQEKRFTVGIHRSKGGTIIGNIKASKVLNVKNIIYINSLLDSIANNPSIEFIALQDSHQVLHKTTDRPLTNYYEDPLVQETFRTKSIHYRISQFDGHKILEVFNYLRIFDSSRYVVQIGLNYSPIQKIQKNALKQASLRLFILIIIGFMMIAYSISTQNVRLLQKKKDKITKEVYSLQADLRQKEKLSVIGELAAGVAHKIRNPLNAISMTIQRLGSEFKVKNDQSEYNSLLKILNKEINNIGEIITQFLQFSRPTAISRSRTNLNKLTQKVVDLYSVKAEKQSIDLNFNPNSKIIAHLDDDKIKQCLINLVENAMDAINGSGAVHIDLKKKEQEAVLIVEDTGPGIDDENLSKIFNLYFTTKPDGTGIGLAQVYRIIAEHDGRIEADSPPGKGAIFTIYLPLKES